MSVLVWDAVGGGLLGLHNYVTSPDKGQGAVTSMSRSSSSSSSVVIELAVV